MKKETIIELISLALENKKYENDYPFEIGKKYLIRTVTYHLIGEVKSINGGFLLFDKMIWLADSGRFKQCMEEGRVSEVEPCDVSGGLNIGSIVDFFEWKHDLPKDQK